MKNKNYFRAVTGFVGLCIFIFIIYMVDLAIFYSIFLYFQSLLAPFMTGIDYLFYVARLSIPYICMYIIICLFFNLQSYTNNSTIKLLKYTIDLNVVKKTKLYIYLRQYNYVFILAFNFILLFIVYYAYINHKYFYLLFVMLFYLSIWIIIKIKHWLFKNEALRYKKVHMLVNIILAVLIGTYISMALEDLHISNVKLYGWENFWKLIDNKYFIKMPSKNYNWNRVFNWSKQASTDRYMLAFKKSLIKPSDNIVASQNDDINLNKNSNISDYLNRMKYEDQYLSKFSNTMYQKFKKIFLIQLNIKSKNFMPASEIKERVKLFKWLKQPYNCIDLAQWYTPESSDSVLYETYLDLVDKKFDNLTTQKVFLIKLHKNYFSLKDFAFFADFEESFKKNYVIFLDSEKMNLDLKNNSILNFEYYNNDLYCNFEFNNLWLQFKTELYIILQENKKSLLLITKKFKSVYTIKTFKFSFKEDVLDVDDEDSFLYLKPRIKNWLKIPDFNKLKVWKTFKVNYKEILLNHKSATRNIKVNDFEAKWLSEHKPLASKDYLNEIFFIIDDDIAYSYSLQENKLTQVKDLIFHEPTIDDYDAHDALKEYIAYYLENVKTRSKAIDKSITKRFTTIFINDIDKSIMELQNNRVHIPTFNSMYHEFLFQNSNDFFKYILENYALSRDLLTSSRSFMTYDMWCNTMHKLLNLNKDSLCLNNLKDFSDFCKSDFTDDLQFNFSLAFDIIQNKYDLNKFLLIPDLEGIPGTFYEYTVKYNQHMDRYYWYEEQEALIDWIYEISYYSLVNIMDTVKVVDGKENDFLYDIINLYLREPKYKWAAQLFENREIDKPSETILLLNSKLDTLEKLEEYKNSLLRARLAPKSDFYYLKALNDKHIMDFDYIENIKQLNWKVGNDLVTIKTQFKWQMQQLVATYSELTDDFSLLHHYDFHNDDFEEIMSIYAHDQETLNYDLGAIGGVGIAIEHFKYFPVERLDIAFEIHSLEKLDFLLEEIERIMYQDFEQFIETEEFENWLADENIQLRDQFNHFLMNYKEELYLARLKVLNKMMKNIGIKAVADKSIIAQEIVDREPLLEFGLEIERLKCIALKNEYLNKLPIYNWYTYSNIEENIDILMQENKDILIEKLKEVSNKLDEEKLKYVEIKKATKLYGKRIMQYEMDKPETKRYLEKNWDDYNYLSNKSDKHMHDWYKSKIGKKK